MEKLQNLYRMYQEILDSYEGDKTDWDEKYRQLFSLYMMVSRVKIHRSINSQFNNWVRTKLMVDIKDEQGRLAHIIAKLSKQQMGYETVK